ncbi:MAG: hypothetical protein ACI8Q1_002429 [Parvicella sp.]|jgi:hypothetical protein
MIKLFTIFVFLLTVFSSFSQSVMLTPAESGRMFHIVEKSKVLQRNLSEYFQYYGEVVYFHYDNQGIEDSLVDYDSIVQLISLEPRTLQIDYNGLSQESTGLLSELASKMALYQLYLELKDRDRKKEEGESDEAYQYYKDTLVLKLPGGVVRKKNNQDVPSKAIIELLNPNLFFNQRANTLSAFQSISQVQQKDVIEAFNYATRSYLNYKGREYFSKICVQSPDFVSNLMACGDGGNTDGLLEEREKIYKHKNELGDPCGIGLFTYKSAFESAEGNRQKLVTKTSDVIEFNSLKDEYTTLHLSLWGFNRPQQTTVAIYREGNMYLLYADKISQELSADSTFGQGATLQSIINQLENVAIPNTGEAINGKNGVRGDLGDKDTSHRDVLYEILETEMELTNLRYNSVKNRKKTKRAQTHLQKLYERKSYLERRQAELKATLAELVERMASFQARLFELKSYLAYDHIKYTKFGYIYTFEDGISFNVNTQNLTFPDSIKTKEFEVRLITFGPDAMSKHVDEIQLLTTVSEGAPEDFDLNELSFEFGDVFKSGQFTLKELELDPENQFDIAKIMHDIYISKGSLILDLTGNGVGVMVDGKVESSDAPELKEYPGETDEEQKEARDSEMFKPLRTSYASIKSDNHTLFIEVESYTDPVVSRFTTNSSKLKAIKASMDSITDNELLSAFRSFQLTELIVKEMLESVYLNFEGKEQTQLMSDLKSMLMKSKVSIRGQYVNYSKYADVAHPDSDYYELCVAQLEKDAEARKKLIYGEVDKKKKK